MMHSSVPQLRTSMKPPVARGRIRLTTIVPLQVEAEGDVATAFTLARILSNIPLSRGGPTSVVIFDIHALQVCARLGLSSGSINCFMGHNPLRNPAQGSTIAAKQQVHDFDYMQCMW